MGTRRNRNPLHTASRSFARLCCVKFRVELCGTMHFDVRLQAGCFDEPQHSTE